MICQKCNAKLIHSLNDVNMLVWKCVNCGWWEVALDNNDQITIKEKEGEK